MTGQQLEWPIVRRAIHTSADFDYARTMVISPDAVGRGLAALRRAEVLSPTQPWPWQGSTRGSSNASASRICCFVADPEVADEAARLGITRSILALRKAAADPGNGIFVIGNAPPPCSNCCDWCGKNNFVQTWSSVCRSDSSEPRKARKNFCAKPPDTAFPSSPTVAGRAVPTWLPQW